MKKVLALLCVAFAASGCAVHSTHTPYRSHSYVSPPRYYHYVPPPRVYVAPPPPVYVAPPRRHYRSYR